MDAPGVSVPTAAAAAAALLAAAAVAWQQLRKRTSAPPVEYPGISGLIRPAQAATAAELDPEYKMALARTRQATAIHRAIGFLNTGERARAHVEVRRALHQNSVCRAPLLNTQHSKGELMELYRLHLQQSDMPTDFGTLLQLRALLDLDFEDAEFIEKEMAQGSTFSI
ncbi:diacylglycerol kinase gamma isoform X1 [Chlorella sorokiniana]|uniref:Diacylglycerol kinase gamma isoform X1 n=1 Tax=Chlorella sorokiniana TaxID=3076 RepID=A0A2P6U4G0_CHLSO|nr:diacylglycerol kinase gamma isoform X1 [Chlorella sorokiniana]|eukprot:PRW61197.1 diacylglycerol kinase gamma isoform X1 [Chlorella sorokiniana]